MAHRIRRPIAGAGCLLLALLTLALAAAWLCPGSRCRVPALDAALLSALAAARSPVLDVAAGLVTWLGSILLLGPLAAGLAVHRLRAGRWREAVLPVCSLGGALAVGQIVKAWAARPRPALHEVVGMLPDGASFPSGHALQAMAGWLAIALSCPPPARRPALVAARLLAVLVGATRLYLQVHFPTDVLFGLIAGALWASGVALLMNMSSNWR